MVETQDFLVGGAAFLIVLSMIGLVASIQTPGTSNPVEGITGGEQTPRYDVQGEFILAGTSSGARIKGDTFDYRTSESGLFSSLNLVGGMGDLAFTGAENIDVTVVLRDKDTGNIEGRYTKNIEKLPLGQETTVNYRFNNIRQGDYKTIVTIRFECGLLTLDCENRDRIERDTVIPK